MLIFLVVLLYNRTDKVSLYKNMNNVGWASTSSTFNPWQPWSCRYQCSVWISNRVHWAYGKYGSYLSWLSCEWSLELMIVSWIGRERWNMDMAPNKQIVQLASPCCIDWEKDNLYAWWHREIDKPCRTDREYSASNCYGSWINCSYGSIMVSSCLLSSSFDFFFNFCKLHSWCWCFLVGLIPLKMTV